MIQSTVYPLASPISQGLLLPQSDQYFPVHPLQQSLVFCIFYVSCKDARLAPLGASPFPTSVNDIPFRSNLHTASFWRRA